MDHLLDTLEPILILRLIHRPQEHHQDHPMAVQAVVIVDQLRMQKIVVIQEVHGQMVDLVHRVDLENNPHNQDKEDPLNRIETMLTLLLRVDQTIKLMIGMKKS